ncbi:MAG: hypothetical protein ABSF71_16120 [Terriglobia bacterium]|jgi:hypothetical protein
MSKVPYGNDPAKIDRYKDFWSLADVKRPLVGFTFVGWFPFGEFSACRRWASSNYLTPEMINPAAFMDDHVRIVREGEVVDDDLLRGAAPTQVAVPFLPGALGCKMRILSDNVMGEEQGLSWEEALRVRLDLHNPWFRKYVEFGQALAVESRGLFPVSHAADLGPTDLHAALRGHSQSILDLTDDPQKSAELLARLGDVFCEFTQEFWKVIPLFHGGYFDGQYSLWSPGPIVRMQEDATAVYSPSLYRKFVQPVDRKLASHFASAFIHLHSSSMFLLDAFLEIEEIRCFEINNDVCGPPMREMVGYFQKVQKAHRPLLIRGALTLEDLNVLLDCLEPRGLFLNIMVNIMNEIETLRSRLNM